MIETYTFAGDAITYLGAIGVASTAIIPIVGKLSDIYGRRAFFLFGIVVFILGSILSGLSADMSQLIAFRAIQGVGGGTLMSCAFIAVGDLFPPAERGKYMGFLAGIFALSSIIGPVTGGALTDSFTWRWAFFLPGRLLASIIDCFSW